MTEFKNGKTLLEEQRANGKLRVYERPIPEAGKPRPGPRNMRRAKETPSQICEFFTLEGCEASVEAVQLGLAEAVFPCQGSIPPACPIREKLIAGVTIQELYEK